MNVDVDVVTMDTYAVPQSTARLSMRLYEDMLYVVLCMFITCLDLASLLAILISRRHAEGISWQVYLLPMVFLPSCFYYLFYYS